MFRRRLTVTVPQPCHEDWQAMAPAQRGRFCQSCQKTVTDFTHMSDAEVVEWLSKQKGNTCGRFRTDQLGKELLAAAAATRQRWTWRAAIIALSAWFSTKAAEAQAVSSNTKLEQSPPSINNSSTVSPPAKSLAANSLAIKGIVLDSTTNAPIPGATVVLKGTHLGVPTDVRGEFNLRLPPDLEIEQQKVLVNFIGLTSQEFSLRDSLMKEKLVIYLAPDHNGLTGEVVVISTKWYSPRNFYYKIRSLFH